MQIHEREEFEGKFLEHVRHFSLTPGAHTTQILERVYISKNKAYPPNPS